MTKSRSGLLTCLAALALLVLSAGSAAAAKTQSVRETAAAPLKVKMAHLPSQNYVAAYVAVERGFFRKRGLDVELIAVTNTNTALLSGSVDLAIQAVDAAIVAAAQGRPTPVLTMFVQHNPTSINIRKSLDGPDLKKPYPLNVRALREKLGRPIEVGTTSRGSGGETVIQSVFQGAGLQEGRDFNVVVLGNGGAITAALASERVDAGILFPSFDIAAWDAGIAVPLVEQRKGEAPDDLVSRYGAAIGASPEWVSQHPAAAKAVVDAMIDGMRYLRNYKNQANERGLIAATKKYAGLTDEAAMKAAFPHQAREAAPHGTCERIATSLRLAIKTGQISVLPTCNQIMNLKYMPKTDPFAKKAKKKTKKKK